MVIKKDIKGHLSPRFLIGLFKLEDSIPQRDLYED